MIRQQKEELMPMITAQHGLFMQEQKHSEGVTARQNTLQAINVTVTTMNRLQSNLNEGTFVGCILASTRTRLHYLHKSRYRIRVVILIKCTFTCCF